MADTIESNAQPPTVPAPPRSEGGRVAALGTSLLGAALEDLLAYAGDLDDRAAAEPDPLRRRVLELQLAEAAAEVARRRRDDPAAVRFVPSVGPAAGVALCDATDEVLRQQLDTYERCIATDNYALAWAVCERELVLVESTRRAQYRSTQPGDDR